MLEFDHHFNKISLCIKLGLLVKQISRGLRTIYNLLINYSEEENNYFFIF